MPVPTALGQIKWQRRGEGWWGPRHLPSEALPWYLDSLRASTPSQGGVHTCVKARVSSPPPNDTPRLRKVSQPPQDRTTPEQRA